MTEKENMIDYLAQRIAAAAGIGRPFRVGIDGVDASGKTTLARQLADYMGARGFEIIRASIDGFHNPRAVRYQKGRMSPEGYYLDSFNNRAVIESLLDPLGPGGSRKYITAAFDFKTDKAVLQDRRIATENAILIMEGVFLLRPELKDFWDLAIFIDADFSSTLPRAIARDKDYLGGETAVIEAYERRYIPGQTIYFTEADPKNRADIIIDNNDFGKPKISKELF